jgi:hypothetical protein
MDPDPRHPGNGYGPRATCCVYPGCRSHQRCSGMLPWQSSQLAGATLTDWAGAPVLLLFLGFSLQVLLRSSWACSSCNSNSLRITCWPQPGGGRLSSITVFYTHSVVSIFASLSIRCNSFFRKVTTSRMYLSPHGLAMLSSFSMN